MGLLLGVDGGNTKTVALVASPEGRVLGAGRSGCGDIYGAESAEAALGEMERAVDAALSAAGATRADVELGVFSLAGADWPEDYEFLSSEIARRGLARRAVVYNDALGALRAGSPDGTGVAVVCGTGLAAGAMAPDGRYWHASFWLEVGGAYHLGEEVLRVVFRSELGLEPPTSLTRRVLGAYGFESVEALLHAITARENRLRLEHLGRLARALLDEADAGDEVACAVVSREGSLMGEYASVAARKVGLGPEGLALVLAGGVFRHPSELLAEAVTGRVRMDYPGVRPVRSRFEPAVGALLLALDETGASSHPAVLERLYESLPHTSLFDT